MTVRDPSEIEAVERSIINLHDTAQLGDDGSLAEGCAPIAEADVHTAFAQLELVASALRGTHPVPLPTMPSPCSCTCTPTV